MEMNVAASAPTISSQKWSPARIYLVASGVFLLILAAAGFMVNRTFPIGVEEFGHAKSGHVFGLLETNGWHNLAGLISGVVALGFAMKAEWARFGALLKGFFYVVVTTSIALWGGETFWIASNGPDQVIHGSLAVGGLLTGWLTPKRREERESV